VAIALLLLWGRGLIRSHEMTAGSFISFLIAVFTLYDPVRKCAMFYNSFQQALGASEEIFRFMDAQDDVREKKKAFVLPGFQREIRKFTVPDIRVSNDSLVLQLDFELTVK